ncbi:unnamed protein product [Darwinula stevensoni]|uniref:N-alpha-acetyltransferase 40 n=1 Tax=Darwinula stevensoni TaxID=69355 RepID=A0A7R9FRP5_9CRUS|nr:unnamed protein product [Darwinula stevensoni]CAG0901414.1 unnamed protein product [Darwinula stevensoni]
MTAPPTKIFVGRLPEHCKSQDLRVLFEQYGKVTECDVLNRYGFVHMSTEEEATAAIKGLNNAEFQGSRISVEQSTGKRGSGRGRGGGPMRGGMGRGRGGMPMRGMGPYDRHPPPMPMRNGFDGYYEDYYDRRGPPPMAREREMMMRDRPRPGYPDMYDRRPPPAMPERRPMPPPDAMRADAFGRPSDMYSRRSPPSFDPYDDPYGARGGARARYDVSLSGDVAIVDHPVHICVVTISSAGELKPCKHKMGGEKKNGMRKAKLKKLKWKMEKEQLNSYQERVNAANKKLDHLEQLKAFRKFDRNGISVNIECCKAENLDTRTRDWVFDLTARNMKHLYLKSAWGWSDREKREELMDDSAWYLLARGEGDALVAFSHFRFDLDSDLPVLYCYELQIEESYQRKGLGRHMMAILELAAFNSQMVKVVLTVFKHNPEAKAFYQSINFSVDQTSPEDDYEETFDYEILSKSNRLLSQCQCHC